MSNGKILYFTPTLEKNPDAKRTLAQAGFALSAVDDTATAVTLAAELVPDFILVDADLSLADFALLNNTITKHPRLNRSCILISTSAEQKAPSIDHNDEPIFPMVASIDLKALQANLNILHTIKTERNRAVDAKLALEQKLALQEEQSPRNERRLTEQLSTAQEHLLLSQSAARIGSWELSLESSHFYWSEQMHRVFGTDPASFETTLEHFIELVHPNDRHNVITALKTSFNDTKPHSLVHRIIRPDQELRIVKVDWSIAPHHSGESVRAIGVARDITDQRQTNTSFDKFARLSEDLLTVSSFGGMPTDVHATWSKALGWSQEELERDGILSFLHPDDVIRTKDFLKELSEGGFVEDFENRYICKDGSIRWFCWNSHVSEETQQIFSLGRDITREKLKGQQLLELNDWLEFITTSANLAYWIMDINTKNVLRSGCFDSCFGYSEPISSWNYDVFIRHVHPDDRDYVDDKFQSALDSESSFNIEFRVVWPDQSVHWLYCMNSFARNIPGHNSSATGVILDITERKLLEAQLRGSRRLEALGQLTGGFAHDFNNLLTVIIGNAESLTEDLEDNQELLPIAEMVLNAAERGSELIKRMLAFARQQKLEPKTLNINELIEGFQPILQRSLGQLIEIELHLAEELWSCRVDPSELENSLLNLAINARDAMSNHGRVVIESSNYSLREKDADQHQIMDVGDYVRLSIKDEGIGMSEEALSKIFVPFYTTKPGGTGLGLAMVYGFIKQSGGYTFIDSSLGQGCKIHLYLPAFRETLTTQSTSAA